MKAKATARYLNEGQVSGMTGRALSTLRNERARGIGMPYIKVGRSVRYDLIDVIGFMDAHKIMTEDSLENGQHRTFRTRGSALKCNSNE